MSSQYKDLILLLYVLARPTRALAGRHSVEWGMEMIDNEDAPAAHETTILNEKCQLKRPLQPTTADVPSTGLAVKLELGVGDVFVIIVCLPCTYGIFVR